MNPTTSQPVYATPVAETDNGFATGIRRSHAQNNDETKVIPLSISTTNQLSLRRIDQLHAEGRSTLLNSVEILYLDHLGVDIEPGILLEGRTVSRQAVVQNYLAQRPETLWVGYGDSKHYNELFQKGMRVCCSGMDTLGWRGKDIIHFSECWRRVIEEMRGHDKAHEFGLRRTDHTAPDFHYYFTDFKADNPRYGYALASAVKLTESESYRPFSKVDAQVEPVWVGNLSRSSNDFVKAIRSYAVIGQFGDVAIPLTWYLFLNREDITDAFRKPAEELFGTHESSYTSETHESGVWMHPDHQYIQSVMPYIECLANMAIDGDLTAIPRIHWWYVHLAPIIRGSGGVVELIVRSICQKHGRELPRWRDGVAPSIEVLLEPDVTKFCKNYHLLFVDNLQGNLLKTAFCKSDVPACDFKLSRAMR